MTVLYTRDGSWPAEIGSEITLSSGFVRTSQTPFTEAELTDAGYLPAPAQPDFDPATHSLGWDGEAYTLTELPLDVPRAARISAIQSKATALLEAGCPIAYEGAVLHIGLSDSSRADLTAMGATAGLAGGGQIPWPDSYAMGWISEENTRIPLPEPADGIMLAAQVGDYYAIIRQTCRTLKDAALAAEDRAELDAIDIDAGWPD